MIELIESVLTNNRSPERAKSVLDMARLLSDVNYHDELLAVEGIIAMSDEGVDICFKIEELVMRCAVSLFNRLGMTVDVDAIDRDYEAAYNILDCVLSTFDSFDDYDTLMAIVNNGEPPVLVIADMVSFILHTDSSLYVDILIDVEDRAMRAITASLASRQLDEVQLVDADNIAILNQVRVFLTHFPQSKGVEVLVGESGSGYLSTEKEMLDNNPVEYNNSNEYIEECASIIAAICISKYTSFDEAYSHIEKIAENFAGSEHDVETSERVVLRIAKVASDYAEAVYTELD